MPSTTGPRGEWFPKPYADRVAKLRVPGGFVLVAAFLYYAAPDARSIEVGVPLAVLGLLLRAWATGHLEKNLELTTSGPYGHLRNPLYAGTLTVAAGLAIAARRWPLAILFAAVFALVYLPVVELEEQHLRELFPGYGEYSRRVPAFWPRVTAAGASKRFRWKLYARNREYQALLGFLAALAVLVWKCR